MTWVGSGVVGGLGPCDATFRKGAVSLDLYVRPGHRSNVSGDCGDVWTCSLRCDFRERAKSAWTSCSCLCLHPCLCLCFCFQDPVWLETVYQRLVNCGEAATASFYLRRAGSEQSGGCGCQPPNLLLTDRLWGSSRAISFTSADIDRPLRFSAPSWYLPTSPTSSRKLLSRIKFLSCLIQLLALPFCESLQVLHGIKLYPTGVPRS